MKTLYRYGPHKTKALGSPHFYECKRVLELNSLRTTAFEHWFLALMKLRVISGALETTSVGSHV